MSEVIDRECKNNTETVKIKQRLSWHLADSYLNCIRSLGIADIDEEFSRLFDEMQNYVINKIKLPSGGDIVETYVVVVQEAASKNP